MQIPVQFRGLFKSALGLSRAKLIYARITLTLHTTIYFTFTLLSCLVLCSLQGVILSDNTTAVNILYDSIRPSQQELGLSSKLTRVVDGWLEMCDGIPGDGDTRCDRVVDLSGEGRRLSGKRRSLKGRAALKRRALKKVELQKKMEELERGGRTVDVEERRTAMIKSARLNRRQANSTLPADPESEESSAESGEDDAESNSEDDVPSSDEEGEDEEEDEEEEESENEQPNGGIIILPPSPTATPSSVFIPSPTGVTSGEFGSSGLPVPTGTGVPGPHPTSRAAVLAAQQGISIIFDERCLHAMTWLEDGLHAAQREDVTLVFANLWMAVIGVIAILTESLPHLGVAFFAHVLSGAWASTRIAHTRKLTEIYNTIFMGPAGICTQNDLLGDWWSLRMRHTIPIVAINALTILVLGWLSWNLFRVYKSQTFSRVGASRAVNRIYRLLLSFSVLLQLSAFFSLASASLWIARAASPTFIQFAKHWKVYAAVFAIFIALMAPWVILGWRCMRKECRTRSIIFFAISFVLLAVSSFMFSSALYRTIFNRWSFFATISVTSFILLVFTIAVGIVCRVNFGKGLSQFLDVSAALDGADFTPVRFDREPNEKGPSDADAGYGWTTFNSENPITEKASSPVGHGKNSSVNTFSEVMLPQPLKKAYTGKLYDPTYHDVESQQQHQLGEYGSYKFALQPASVSPGGPDMTPLGGGVQDPFQTAAELTSAEIDRMVRTARASKDASDSVWSSNRSPIKLSYSPTIVRGGPASTARSPPISRRESSSSTIMPDDSASRVGGPTYAVMDISRGAQGEFKSVDVVPPSVKNSPQPQLKSRWSATTATASQAANSNDNASKTVSVISASQFPHPKLMVANPDAYRASLVSNAPVPPVPIPTTTSGSPTGRGMVAAFPVRSDGF